ncbi:hypothetical protein [Pseudomonas sp. NPDC007930]|uniref:hypothetical protein n=1 Tax=Pseudomonas sp. NPDC007930 TaxID=3364417 RepID=UPI0036E10942
MSMYRLFLPAAAALAMACAPHAQAADAATQVFSAFSHCDSQLFSTLAKVQLPAATVVLSRQGDVASPRVMNPLQPGGRYQAFEHPLVVNGVRLTGYYNEASSLGEQGNLLYWGFTAEGDAKTVAERLAPLIADHARMGLERGEQVRSEMRRVGDPIDQWRTDNPIGSGVATPFGFVERVLEISGKDTTPELRGQVTLLCSLQGTVTAPLLQVYRPDLNAHLLD